MELRKLTIDDYEEIIKLWSRAKLAFKPKGRDSKEAFAVQMMVNPDFFLGTFENNRLIGTVVISSDTRKGWINRLAVDPDLRRQGLAEALIAESEKILSRHGIRVFCALIEDYNDASKELFKECGYVEHRDIVYFSKRESKEI